MKDILNRFQYYLLPSTTPPAEYVKLHDQVFDLWMTTWKDTLATLNFDASHLHEDFVRQDVISCITFEDRPVACLLFTFYDINAKASREFSYFKNNYTELFMQKLKSLGINRTMAMQYMAIHPEWRGKAKPPIHSGLALAGLSIRSLDTFSMDAGIAPMRKDHKVNELYYNYGATCLIKDHMSHNAPCDLVAAIRGKTHRHPDEAVFFIEEHLWNNRIDLVGLSLAKQPKLQAA